MKQIVINTCHGGFGLSHEAMLLYAAKRGLNLTVIANESDFASYTPYFYEVDGEQFYDWDIARDDPNLIATVRELGEHSGHRFAELKIIEIPDDVNWVIRDYDGKEFVVDVNRCWS